MPGDDERIPDRWLKLKVLDPQMLYQFLAMNCQGELRLKIFMDPLWEGISVMDSLIHQITRINLCQPLLSFQFEKSLSGPLDFSQEGSLVLKNKSPRWHEQLKCWCLNFHGRVTVASVKNFQLVASPEDGQRGPEHDNVILQFGKVEKDVFTMDYRYPMSAFQAFAICLSSFDTKIACE